MTITFESTQNSLTSQDLNFHFKEQEDLKYFVSITPNENKYILEITSDTKTTDPNRFFLFGNLHLEEATAPGNTMKFWLFMNNERIGTLYFEYYPETDYKTFQVCLTVDIFTNAQDALFVFRRIQNFKLIA